MSRIKLIHFMNQFFAGIGGEEKADVPVDCREGPLGPGKHLQALLGDSAEIVVTIYCGDNYFAEHTNEALASILQIAREQSVDLVVAGPAFQAGRYGFACVEVCHFVSASLGLDCVIGMSLDNPGLTMYKQYKNRKVFAFPTRGDVIGMEDALAIMARGIVKLAGGLAMGPASEEGYIPRGIRVVQVVSKSGAKRAVDMMLDKVTGRLYDTEVPIEILEEIPIAQRIVNLRNAHLVLASTAGVHATGNPYGFKSVYNTQWAKYPIDKLNSLAAAEWMIIHGGYDISHASHNPNYAVPLDMCRDIEEDGKFARLNPSLYATTGNLAPVLAMQAIGKEMCSDMKTEGVDGVLLVST